MLIEVIGIHDKNKGAVLMLEAVCERLRREFEDVRIAVPVSVGPETRLRLGLWGTIPPEASPFDLSWVPEYLPERLMRAAGLVRHSEVDAVLDASGFGYGDYWGERKLRRRLVARLRRWRGPGRRTVLLPQALGPFTSARMRDLFKEVIERADLVFARDDQSFAHANALGSFAEKLRQAPDFTNLLKPELPMRLSWVKGRALIIPNRRVVAEGDSYLKFLETCAHALRGGGKAVAMLVHEGVDDRKIADELNARMGAEPLDLIEVESAIETKAVVASAGLVISSRFHGLVSALSSGVPSLACGWSHKYAELMKDYGCPENIVSLSEPVSWRPLLERFISKSQDASFRRVLVESGAAERTKSEAMWADVMDTLGTTKRSH